MNNKLQIFANEQFGSVRIIIIESEPWFVGKDVAMVLGYVDVNKAIAMHVDEEDKLNDKSSPSFGQRGAWLINESGLYSLILSSKLPQAKEFKRWVTSEVLPSIRKHGMYATEELLENPDIAIAAFQALKEERAARKALEAEKAALLPKASYYDVILNCPDLISVTQIAKDYGMSAIELNTILSQEKVQFKQGGEWILYQKYAEKGYAGSRTGAHLGKSGEVKSHSHTYWTQKGREFIYKLLKEKRGIVPIMERETEETA